MAILGELVPRRTRRHRFRRGCGLLSLSLALFVAGAVQAADAVSTTNPATASPAVASEYQLKAVFLFNFTKYAEWPATAFSDAQAPFVIGVLGDDPFGASLDEIVQGEKVNGRPLVIHRYNSAKDDLKSCQILFVSQNEAAQLDQIVASLKGRNVLTVGDVDKFTDRGGIICLVMEKNKIRLKINLEAAKAAGLTISSNLLRAAEVTGHAQN